MEFIEVYIVKLDALLKAAIEFLIRDKASKYIQPLSKETIDKCRRNITKMQNKDE